MIQIKAKTIAQAWRESCSKLYSQGKESAVNDFYRHSPAFIEVADTSHNLYDNNFPMSEKEIKTISNYLITGKEEDAMIHDWTKIYRQRLFTEKDNQNQIENIINYLKKKPTGKRAQASIWNQQKDLYSEIGPCLQIVWVQILDNKLEMHIHMRATDCYGKLLMNMNEFATLQHYISEKLSLKIGNYIQFIDSLHFNLSDKNKVDKLLKK